MWKIIKKILRTICIWMIIVLTVALPVFADENVETMPAPEYVTLRRYNANQARCNTGSTLPFRVAGGTVQVTDRIILKYESALKKDTFYHMRYTFDINGLSETQKQEIQEIGTGAITDQGGQVRTIMTPVNKLLGKAQLGMWEELIDISWQSILNDAIENYVGAKVYYYYTVKGNEVILDSVMYFNDEFWNYGWNYDASHARYMQCYLGIVIPFAGNVVLEKVETIEVGGSDYNGKLDQIISILQSQGGGLTREDIQAATLAALEQHDAAEQQKGNAAINDAQNQLNNAFNPYLQNLNAIKESFNGFTTALSYSGTSCVISLPAAINPMTNTELWSAQNIDLGSYYNQIPQALRSLIRASISALIFYSVILEVIDTIRRITGVSDND